MSLLLDALKKAERDKQKAREAEAGSVDFDAQAIQQEVVPADSVDEPDVASVETLEIEGNVNELELVIDEQEETVEEVEQSLTEENKRKVDEPPPSTPVTLEKSAATTSTVSDEALQLLVYKTNKRYRKKQKLIWGSLLATTVIVLIAAGTYYYFGMLEEVDALERKHQLAMRDVRSEPVKRYEVAATNNEPEAVVKVRHAQDASEIKQQATEKQVREKPKPVRQTGENSDF